MVPHEEPPFLPGTDTPGHTNRTAHAPSQPADDDEPMPTTKRKHKVWVWLTVQQIDALLKAAGVIDAKPEALEAMLPERGDRLAFRGAATELRKVRDAMEIRE